MPTLSTQQAAILIETIANTAGIDEAVAALGTLEAEAKTKAASVKSAMNTIGMAGTVMSVAIIAGVTEAAKSAASFQQAMMMIQTQAGATSQEVQKMSQAVLDMSTQTATAPTALANALFYVESAGYRGAEALDILRASAEGAKVGNADLDTVTKAMVATMASHVKGIDNATEAMGYLNATVGAGTMKMQDLTSSLSSGIIPAAQSFGLGIKDVSAALATMTDLGVPADEAATRLRMTFSLLGAPTKQAAGDLESIGLSSRQLADDMRNGGLLKALEDLNTHLNETHTVMGTVEKGTKTSAAQMSVLKNEISDTQARLKILSEEHVKAGVATDKHNLSITEANQKLAEYQGKLGSANTMIGGMSKVTLDATQKAQLLSNAFGGGRSSATILTLLQNLDRLDAKYKQIGDSTKNFANSWAQTQQTAQYNFDQLNASMQKLTIEFGATLLPLLVKFVNFLTNSVIPVVDRVIQFFEKHKAAATALEIVIGVLLVGALVMVVAWFASMVAAVVAAIGVVAGFIGIGTGLVALIIGGIVAAVIILINYWKELGNVFSTIGAVIKSIVSDVAGAVISFVNMVINAINTLVQGAVGIANKIPGMHLSIGSIPNIGGGGNYTGNTGNSVLGSQVTINNNVTANTPFDLNSFNGNMGLQLSSALGR